MSVANLQNQELQYQKRLTEIDFEIQKNRFSLIEKPIECDKPSLITSIIMIVIGSVLLPLAYYQILPNSIQAINSWGQIIGFGTLGFGSVLFLIALKRSCDTSSKKESLECLKQEGRDIRKKIEELKANLPQHHV